MLTTAVALSGGIDSLVAAYLLKKSGHHIFGLHFVSGYETPSTDEIFDAGGTEIAKIPQDHPLSEIKNRLDIDIWMIDCRRAFDQKIVNYFIDAYMRGHTPNPCMVCNAVIKFGLLLKTARRLGATHLATGHYATIEKTPGNRFQLKKGLDPDKEQSYFLAMLNQEQLAHAHFPIGRLTKAQVCETGAENHLMAASGHESQDVCFIKNKHYSEFLGEKANVQQRPGEIIDVEGNFLGLHKGLYHYTIGQRRGINCPAPKPYYVIRLDMANNQLVVGFKEDLYRNECKIDQINWITEKPETGMEVKTKIRYRHEPVASKIYPTGEDTAIIRFARPQPAVTPGQTAVCYSGDQVIAGGWIYG